MPPKSAAHHRSGSKGGVVDPYHPVLESTLMILLQKHFGVNNVVRDNGWVDLTVLSKKRKLLIELKTDPVAKRAIREAMGQTLEFAYFEPTSHHLDLELYIVAPSPSDAGAANYLKMLNVQFGITVGYYQFTPGGNLAAPISASDARTAGGLASSTNSL